MHITAVMAAMRIADLDHFAKHAVQVVAAYAEHPSGLARVGIGEIAAGMGVHYRTASRALDRAIEAGYLAVDKHRGRQTTWSIQMGTQERDSGLSTIGTQERESNRHQIGTKSAPWGAIQIGTQERDKGLGEGEGERTAAVARHPASGGPPGENRRLRLSPVPPAPSPSGAYFLPGTGYINDWSTPS
jgi:hypothetical protein